MSKGAMGFLNTAFQGFIAMAIAVHFYQQDRILEAQNTFQELLSETADQLAKHGRSMEHFQNLLNDQLHSLETISNAIKVENDDRTAAAQSHAAQLLRFESTIGKSMDLQNVVKRRANEMGDDIQQMTDDMAGVKEKIKNLEILASGEKDIEGLRSAFQRQSFAIMQHRMEDVMGNFQGSKFGFKQQKRNGRKLLSSEGFDTERAYLAFVVPTHKRINAQNPHDYLKRVLRSIISQNSRDKAMPGKIIIIVINTGPIEHTGVQDAINEVVGDHDILVAYQEVQNQFKDPYEDYQVKVDRNYQKDILESWPPSRKHSMHLSEVLLKALLYDSRYYILVEDDMVLCETSKRSALEEIYATIEHANSISLNWTGIRVGYGGNGLILQQQDLAVLADYIVANLYRRPPDWLLTEWYKALTFSAKMNIGSRHKGFTYKYNVFEHIGEHSSFPGREKQGSERKSKESNGKVKIYNIPGCFEFNWYLLPEERFDERLCHSSDYTPC
eukprot:m.305850 g.305850  ORF g.305850 m.305850 type:complete len:499 (+) comp16451_c0_seq26:221-1717(+)